jgi:hypothetical protein
MLPVPLEKRQLIGAHQCARFAHLLTVTRRAAIRRHFCPGTANYFNLKMIGFSLSIIAVITRD